MTETDGLISRKAVLFLVREYEKQFDPVEQYEIATEIGYLYEKLRTIPVEGLKDKTTAVWRGWTKSYYKGRDDDDEPIWGRCTYYICSNCGRRTVIADPFCPGCGASMEKEM